MHPHYDAHSCAVLDAMGPTPILEKGQTTPPSVLGPLWEAVEQALLRHHHGPDLQAARALCACVAAHGLNDTAPVWPMLVGPPGSMKTHLLSGFRPLKNAHYIDTITPKTFISGQIDDPQRPSEVPASLLNRIGAEGVLLTPDFSTVLALKPESKAAILADMRRIYDGELRKEFGIGDGKVREWKGRITFLVAVTGEIDRHYSIFQTLGERFVMIRWGRAAGIEAALAAMDQDSEEAKADLQRAIAMLFAKLSAKTPALSKDIKHAIAHLAEIAVRARTHVHRNGQTKTIEYIPEAESPTRLAQQLASLARGSARLAGRAEVTADDLALVHRVGLDSIPPPRRAVLDALRQGGRASDTGLPKSTVSYVKEDLEAHGLLDGDGFSELAATCLKVARLM